MRHYDHLLDKFPVSNKTRELASELLRQAKLRTAQGSGHEHGVFSVGLPAVCILLASERLNANEMSQQSAQSASCLKKNDFQRVYSTVRAVIAESEKNQEAGSSYAELHERYSTGVVAEKLGPYLTEVENELKMFATRYDHTSAMVRCAVYFWVCASAKIKSIPPTAAFATAHHLPLKKFTGLLHALNSKKLDLRNELQKVFGKIRTSSKESALVSPSATMEEQQHLEPRTPRRSQRTLAMQQESLPKATPTKRTPKTAVSPIKFSQPATPRLRFPNKVPMRELPSKDTPKKRVVEALQEQENVGEDLTSPEEPPTKRAKTVVDEALSKRITRSASAAALSGKAKAEAAAIEAVEAVEAAILKSPRKRKGGQPQSSEWSRLRAGSEAKEATALIGSASSDEESEPVMHVTRRRFRPIYLELKQWNAKDPRLSKVWKKAEKKINVSMQSA